MIQTDLFGAPAASRSAAPLNRERGGSVSIEILGRRLSLQDLDRELSDLARAAARPPGLRRQYGDWARAVVVQALRVDTLRERAQRVKTAMGD